MAALPDGGTVSAKTTERWNIQGPPSHRRVYFEGWNVALLIMGTLEIDEIQTTVTEGDGVTLTGEARDENGNSVRPSIEVTRPDGTTDSVTPSLEVDGDYAAEYTPPEPGEYSAVATTEIPGSVQTEGWNIQSPPSGSLRVSEGWEEP